METQIFLSMLQQIEKSKKKFRCQLIFQIFTPEEIAENSLSDRVTSIPHEHAKASQSSESCSLLAYSRIKFILCHHFYGSWYTYFFQLPAYVRQIPCSYGPP